MKLLLAHFFLFLSLFISSGHGSAAVTKTINVNSKGGGDFKSIQAAVDSVPANNNQWIRIHVAAGVYQEKVTIPANKGFILMEGDGALSTSIEYGGHADSKHTIWESSAIADTAGSATVTVSAVNTVFKGITFKNTFNGGSVTRQAVAVLLYGDKASFYNCRFLGIQDTLGDMFGRHYFADCDIEGAIDFIFGRGQSIYERCTLSVVQSPFHPGHVTAQSRESESDPSGYVFKSCKITGSQQTYLGRAWGPYSRVIFYQTNMDNIIVPEGWFSWSFMGKESRITYVEAGCKGPGSNLSQRVKWEKQLDTATLNKFVDISFIDNEGWLKNQP